MEKAQHVIVIGGSAGSYNFIIEIIEALPKAITAAVVIVIHRNPKFATKIEEILAARLQRTVITAEDKAPVLQNTVYFATPSYHLLIEPNLTFALDVSEQIQFSRPSIDVLFASAADIYKERCVGILLSGANSDGSDGIKHITKWGGKVFIHSPHEALIPTMPENAMKANEDAEVLTQGQIIAYMKNIT